MLELPRRYKASDLSFRQAYTRGQLLWSFQALTARPSLVPIMTVLGNHHSALPAQNCVTLTLRKS
jgi:hypothetical protein